MPIAALPDYIKKQDLSSASPGMRFGMYFRGWNRDFSIPDSKKKDTYRSACEFSSQDKGLLLNLASRQQALFSHLDPNCSCALSAESIAPFTTGLGNEHPLENGFAFLWPYGLPYLPGSGVKGVLRQAARELAEGDWGDTRSWTKEAITVLFGSEDSNDARRGALTFWDLIPQIRGNELAVEVMTPHQSHYYRDKAAPHDSGQPVPIYFLTVPPGSGFEFHVTCNLALLKGMVVSENWRKLLQAAFEHAFDWLGFGAKTAVGYGAMAMDREREEQQRREVAEARIRQQRDAELAAMSPVEREIRELMENDKTNPAIPLYHALCREQRWEAPEDQRKVAHKIRELWQQQGKWIPDFTGSNKKKKQLQARSLEVRKFLE